MVLPWELRVATLLPVSPFTTGVLLAAALSAVYLVARWLLDVPWWIPDETLGWTLTGSGRLSLVISMLTGYTIAVGRFLSVSYTRDLQRMQLLPPEPRPKRTDREMLRIPIANLRKSRFGGFIGLGLGLLFILWLHDLLDESFLENIQRFSDASLLAMALLLFWLLGRAAFMTLASFALPEFEIDLMNLRRLHGFGRIALRQALAWIVGASILSLVFLTPDFTIEGVLLAFAPVFAASLAIAALALLLPVRGVQRRIRHAKAKELASVDAALSRVRSAALGGDSIGQERLAGLLAYRSHVQGLAEWPFDTSMRLRFVLYLLIPLGSWLGGAFVERFVSAMID